MVVEIYGPDIVDKDEKFTVRVKYRREYYDPLCPPELIIYAYGYWNGGRSMNILFDKTYPMEESGEIPITIGANSYEWIDIWACEKYRRYTGVCSVFKQECTKKKVEVRLPPRPTPTPIKGSFSVSAPQSVKVGEPVPIKVTFHNPNSTEALFKATVTFAGTTKEIGIEVPANSTKTVTKEFTAPAKPGTYTVTASTIMYVLGKVFDLGKKTIEVEVTAPPKVSFSVSAPGEVEVGQKFYVTVSITTNVKGSVKVEGKVGTKAAGWSGSVNPGTTDVRLPFTLDAPGTYTGYVTVYFNGNKVGTRAFTVKVIKKEEEVPVEVPTEAPAKVNWWPLAVAGGVVAGLALLLRRRRPWRRFSRRRY